MSSVEHGTELGTGLGMRAGHSTIPGTRQPPSHNVPLLPRRNPVLLGPAAPPLSLQYQTMVSSAIPSSRSASRKRPTLRSIAVSSPKYSWSFSDSDLYASLSFGRARWGV